MKKTRDRSEDFSLRAFPGTRGAEKNDGPVGCGSSAFGAEAGFRRSGRQLGGECNMRLDSPSPRPSPRGEGERWNRLNS